MDHVLNSQSSSNLILLSQGNTSNNNISGPTAVSSSAMDCDPPQMSSSSSSAQSPPAANLLRGYGAPPPHMHRIRYLPSQVPPPPTQVPTAQLLALHGKMPSMVASYAPTSLPIDLGMSTIGVGGSVMYGGGSSGALSMLDTHHHQQMPPLPPPPHHLLVGGSTGGPFASLTDSLGGHSGMTGAHHGQQKVSRGSSNGGNSAGGGSGGATNPGAPTDPDESPMVGVCIQQSPVVIH